MKIKKIASLIVTGAMLIMSFPAAPALAASLTTGSVLLSDSRPSQAATTYTVQFSGVTLSAIKCIKVQFSDAATAGAKPTGMTVTSAAFSGTSNYIPTPASWTVTNDNSAGNVKLTFATGETPASASSRTVVLTTITNGSTAGTAYFVQFSTFNNTDCATSPVDSATIAYIYTTGQTVSATVDPTLSFTVNSVASAATVNGATTTVTTSSSTIPLGTLSTGANSIAAQDLTVGTNAQNGFTVTVKYTGSLTSGSHNMTDHTGTNAAPTAFSAAGTEAFGYTTEDFTLGTGTAARFSANNWAGLTTSPLEVVYNAGAASLTTRVGYQAGISATTPSGSYTTTVVYVATPTY
jgi:hypothetical protein